MSNSNTNLNDFFRIIENFISKQDFNDGKVVDYLNPQKLQQRINLEITDEGEDFSSLNDYAKKYFELCVNTGNKQFLNQLYSGFNLPAFMGDIIASASNTSIYTYEVAPVAIEIERELIRIMNSYTGYENGDGIFVTGGSNANLVAMFSARNYFFPESRYEGTPKNHRLTAFVSDQSHYSFENTANMMGIGAKALIKVKSDSSGRMIPSELENELTKSKARGETPFFVGATCSTTLLGAFDPLDKIGEVCKRHNVWFHADGALGGSLILSSKYREKFFKGIEHTDSFTWDAHKLMNIPLISSVILVKRADTLQHNITNINADYIFHDIEEGVEKDLGKKSLQCGRRVDALKLWFAWKHFGKNGYAKRIENLIEMAEYAEQIVKQTSQLELLAPRQSVSICFRYVPQKKVDLNDFNLKVRETLRKSGKSLVNFGYIDEVLTIRLVISNGEMDRKDVEQFFQNFLEVARTLEDELNG